MNSKYLVITMFACISAPTITAQLSILDQDTVIASMLTDSKTCDTPIALSICGFAKSCIHRADIAASSCKKANDAAATKQPADLQYTLDLACKSDLATAYNSCKLMKESKVSYADMGVSKDVSIIVVPGDFGVTSDIGTRSEAHD